ncbi:hypothetical protein U9M48_008678, partial [Paspalum notatum var. saurae]
DRFPTLRRSKLMPRAHFKVLTKINDNAYILDLLRNLKPYVGEDEELPSRTTSISKGRMMRTSTTTPASTPRARASSPTLGPITRARARELNYIMLLKNEGPEE